MNLPRLSHLKSLAPYGIILAAVVFAAREVVVALNGSIIGLAEEHWVKGVTWYYWNYATSPWRGINPFESNLQAYPVGFDQLALAGNFGDALHAMPFFWLFPVPAAYNLTAMAFLIFNGAAAYIFFRRWWGGQMLPLLFAIANTFHPLFYFFLDEGRPTQLLFGWVYLALAGAKGIVDDPRRGSIRLLVAGLTGSFVCFWFNGFFLYLLLPLVWLAAAREMSPEARRALIRRGAWALALAALLAFPFGLPLLYDVFWGPGIKGVRMFTMPDPYLHAGFSARPWEPLLLHPRYQMWLPYSAVALALLALTWGRRWSGRPTATLGFVAGGVIFYILILGPYLCLGEQSLLLNNRYVSLPWAWIAWIVPFYSRLTYPYLVFPFLSIVVLFLSGQFLSRLAARGGWRKPLAWCLGAALMVEVLVRGGLTVTTTPFPIPEIYHRLRADASVRAIIEYPFGAADFRQVYQVVHLKPVVNSKGFELNFLEINPRLKAFFARTPALRKLHSHQLHGEPLSAITAEDLEQLKEQHFDVLIATRQAFERSAALRSRGQTFESLITDLDHTLGQPIFRTTDMSAYRIQGRGSSPGEGS